MLLLVFPTGARLVVSSSNGVVNASRSGEV